MTGRQKEANEGWLNIYCAPFDLADQVVRFRNSMGFPIERAQIENDQNFRNWNIEYIEKVHCHIESTGIKYMEFIRQDDLKFWDIEKSRDEFSFFLCNQYFRTKYMHDSIIMVFNKRKATAEEFMDVCPENMWLPLSLIFASNVGAHITQKYSAVLLQTDDSRFIVGDQPVVNTYSTFNMLTPPNDVELYYPITPQKALLLTTDLKYTNGQKLMIEKHKVTYYNMLELKASRELVFAKDRTHFEWYAVM